MLTVTGTVIPSIAVEPSTVVLGRFPSSITKHAEVRLFSFFDYPLEVKSTELVDKKTADHFEIAVEPVVLSEIKSANAKSGLVLSISIKPGLPAGPIRQTIQVSTNVPDGRVLTVSVDGTVRD